MDLLEDDEIRSTLFVERLFSLLHQFLLDGGGELLPCSRCILGLAPSLLAGGLDLLHPLLDQADHLLGMHLHLIQFPHWFCGGAALDPARDCRVITERKKRGRCKDYIQKKARNVLLAGVVAIERFVLKCKLIVKQPIIASCTSADIEKKGCACDRSRSCFMWNVLCMVRLFLCKRLP
ncbi:unnamed protein product, partial [Musa hybrid cultivar]